MVLVTAVTTVDVLVSKTVRTDVCVRRRTWLREVVVTTVDVNVVDAATVECRILTWVNVTLVVFVSIVVNVVVG